MVCRTLEVVNQETNGRQAVMHVRSIGLHRQGLEIDLSSLLVVALGNGLTCLLAQTLNSLANHELRPQLMAVGGEQPLTRVYPPNCTIISRSVYGSQPQ